MRIRGRTWIDGQHRARGLLRIAERRAEVGVDRDQHPLRIEYATGLRLKQKLRIRRERAAAVKSADLSNAVGSMKAGRDDASLQHDGLQTLCRRRRTRNAVAGTDTGAEQQRGGRAAKE